MLAVLVCYCLLGGGKRVVKVTSLLVPVMGIVYVLVSLVVTFTHITLLPQVLGRIFRDAFDFRAIFGGFASSCMMYGIKRGLYSNEAGCGSAPNAAACADVSHPVKQGLVQMLSVFIDTLLICTATAFLCLVSGVTPSPELSGAPYVQQSLAATLGSFGPVFLTIAMSLFAFTTLIGNYSYCEGCLEFILRRLPKRWELLAFRLWATVLIFVGAIANAGIVWNLADMLQGMIVVVNVPTILILGGTALRCLEDYTHQLKEGKAPRFVAKRIGINEPTDFWNE